MQRQVPIFVHKYAVKKNWKLESIPIEMNSSLIIAVLQGEELVQSASVGKPKA